ncbi:MAG: tRNA uridine-5-carboxymethylaminomethyl(34) synthesis GTPase MnmE [Oscillospiraceae bacterium]|nr:tRNA uridine-5-carboxymethylaminomethyl(34) synthesis GTPase MnmE [Oscillospiraceae bacterium]
MATIAAVATPDAVGGISVIRISGDKSLEIADAVFEAVNNVKPSQMQGYTCSYGFINDSENKHVDDVVLTVFRAPKSYTGEDVVEISCHGGRYITKKILRIVLKNGAEPAMAGEFTKRAFLNGKLSLTQAEGVMDVISSSGESQLKYANALKDGAVYRRITGIKNQLVEILGNLAAWADFPEEDVPEVDPLTLSDQIDRVVNDLTKTIATYDHGRIVREGINTVICGKPNVGKSTLMNCLSGYQRSIVTDIAGTTRDVIEESVVLGDLTLRLSDTAGIRTTDDVIESMGVDIAYQRIEQADLILAVFDCTSELDEKETELIDKIFNKNSIAIINKIDGENKIDRQFISDKFRYVVEISAKNEEGTDKLVSVLNEMFINNRSDADEGIIANERQKCCLEKALDNVNEAYDALNCGMMLDAVTVCLDSAVESLMELTGEKASETIVNDVFSRFCVGK